MEEKDSELMSFKEHLTAEELSEFKVMKSPIVLLALMATLHKRVKSKEEKTLAKMVWISAQMTFSFMGELEKKIDGLSKQIERLKS